MFLSFLSFSQYFNLLLQSYAEYVNDVLRNNCSIFHFIFKVRAVALKSRIRRSSVVQTQRRGLREEDRVKLGSLEDLSGIRRSSLEDEARAREGGVTKSKRKKKARRTSTVQLKTENGDM